MNIIVHDLAEVNAAISRGEYFWTDIIRDGVVLYDLPGHPLALPKPLTPADALAMAQQYSDTKAADVESWLRSVARSKVDWAELSARKIAAFQLHQAVEAAYIAALLVHTFYFPRSHKIKFLRSLAEDMDNSLVAAWPRETKIDRRRFETLKRAYVEARYSDQYDVSDDDLRALELAARQLAGLVSASSLGRIAQLREADRAARRTPDANIGGRRASVVLP